MSDVSTISQQRGKKRKADDALDKKSEKPMPSLRNASNMPPRQEHAHIATSLHITNVTSFAYGGMATIEVGIEEQKRTFYAHRGLLSFYSGYFQAALKGSWTEAETGRFVFDDEDVDVVERSQF